MSSQAQYYSEQAQIFARSRVAARYPHALQAFAATGHYSQFYEDLALYEQFRHDWVQLGDRATFVELGALDGLTHSNTLAFERAFNMTGVLIEANPASCSKLFRNRPQTHNLCSAISNESTRSVTFERGAWPAAFAGVEHMRPEYRKRRHWSKRLRRVQVPSSPLGKLLRAVGVAKIELFSLDVVGAELMALNTFDWSIPVNTWCIDTPPDDPNRTQAIGKLMRSHGYVETNWTNVADARLLTNSLWRWPSAWTPEKYRWRQWRGSAES